MTTTYVSSIAVLDGTSPRSRSTDPVTSVDAGRIADLNGSQSLVYGLMATGGTWTQAELEVSIFIYSPSRVRSAVSELAEQGLVELTGETRPTRFGREARVYRAVTDHA